MVSTQDRFPYSFPLWLVQTSLSQSELEFMGHPVTQNAHKLSCSNASIFEEIATPEIMSTCPLDMYHVRDVARSHVEKQQPGSCLQRTTDFMEKTGNHAGEGKEQASVVWEQVLEGRSVGGAGEFRGKRVGCWGGLGVVQAAEGCRGADEGSVDQSPEVGWVARLMLGAGSQGSPAHPLRYPEGQEKEGLQGPPC